MRPVIINGTPPQDWLDEAKRLTDLLQNAASEQERQDIIDANETLWRDDTFRNWLIDQFHRKCWYSEAKESVSSYHVDHFRPKKRVKELDGSFHEGYWWLAFNWKNYRISGQLLNIKKSDQFPLNGGNRASSNNDDTLDDNSLTLEAPILIDPRKEEAWYISFNENGEATCDDDNVDNKFRVDKTIEILGLNRLDRLVENRMDKWNECVEEILRYKNAGGPQPLEQVQKASAVTSLKRMIRYEMEFSSVAIACTEKTAPKNLRKRING